MYCKLHERVALRGWKLVPYAYYIYGVEQAQGLTAEQFGLLSRCDGEHDLPDSPLLQRFLQAGMIRPCEKGERLDEWQKPRFYKNRYFPISTGPLRESAILTACTASWRRTTRP